MDHSKYIKEQRLLFEKGKFRKGYWHLETEKETLIEEREFRKRGQKIGSASNEQPDWGIWNPDYFAKIFEDVAQRERGKETSHLARLPQELIEMVGRYTQYQPHLQVQLREEYVYYAKLAEQAERYDDMWRVMNAVAKMGVRLTNEERNLLSVAAKNAVGSMRASWRILKSIEEKEKNPTITMSRVLQREKESLIHEADTFTAKVLSSIKGYIKQMEVRSKEKSPEQRDTEEDKVFLHKMAADYHRFTAEFYLPSYDGKQQKGKKEKEEKETEEESPGKYHRDKADEYYRIATKLAENLSFTNPFRLGVALNRAVFHYECLNDPDGACEMAKKAFDDGLAALDYEAEGYNDGTLIMQLLRDNLTLWQNPEDEEEEEGQD